MKLDIQSDGTIINDLLLQKDYITAIRLLTDPFFKKSFSSDVIARALYRLIVDKQYNLAQSLYNSLDMNVKNKMEWNLILNSMIMRDDRINIAWILQHFYIPKDIINILLSTAKQYNKSEIVSLFQKYLNR